MFLDDGFSAESVASRLRKAGFTVERFPDWFKDASGRPLRNIPDSDIIKFCQRNGWMLVTRDHEMKNMHREEIRKTDVAILSTAHNSAEDQQDWVNALIRLKARILREFKNRERPWFATFSRTATMKIETIE